MRNFKVYIKKVTVACTFGCILQSLHANMKYNFFREIEQFIFITTKDCAVGW